MKLSLLLLLFVLHKSSRAFKCRHGECFRVQSMDRSEILDAQVRDIHGELLLLRRQVREMHNSSVGVREDHLILQHQLETCHLMVNTALKDTQVVKNLQNHMVTSLDGSMGRFERLTRLIDDLQTQVQQQSAQIEALNRLVHSSGTPQVVEVPAKRQIAKGFVTGANSDCQDLWQSGNRVSSIYSINVGGKPLQVFCDMNSHGGHILLQRRIDGTVDFKRKWEQYKYGFGNPFGEVWLGLEWIHRLTALGRYTLLVRLCDWQDNCRIARYGRFLVLSETDKYKLRVGSYSGTAGDALSHHHDMGFSTPDVDNDISRGSCAKFFSSGWWFRSCIYSNLNGVFYKQGWYARESSSGRSDGIVWSSFVHEGSSAGNGDAIGSEFYSFRRAEMLLVRKD